MTVKRFTVHTMLEDYQVGEDDLKGHIVEILDNGNHMTYKECCNKLNALHEENEQLKQSVNNLKETILKITIAYQRKHDNTIINLVDEVHEEDITDLIKELKE